ncbi:MAG: AtpZ/AtpI family protein [Phycisphaerales bacterium]
MTHARPGPDEFDDDPSDPLGDAEREAIRRKIDDLEREAAEGLDPRPLGSVREPMAMPEVLRERPGSSRAGTRGGHGGLGGGEFGGGASARAWGVGLNFGAMVIAGGVLGWLVDWLGSAPWGLLVGLLTGLVVGFTRFVREALAANRSMAGRGRRGPM